MKVSKFIIPMFAFGALIMASCSSEEPVNNNVANDSEGVGYLAFRIANDNTRAGESNEIFSNGDANEYAMSKNNLAHAAFFFDGSGNFYGMSNLESVPDAETDHDFDHEDDNYGDSEVYCTYVTRWRNTSADKPSQVLVVLNGVPDTLDELADQLKEKGTGALEFAVANSSDTFNGNSYVYGLYNDGTTDFFTMSNAAFTDQKNTVTQLAGNVFATAPEALENPVTVYVERLLAKFQLTFGPDADELKKADDKIIMTPKTPEGNEVTKINYVASYTGEDLEKLDYPDYTQIAWKAYIVNWGINALENKGNLVKDISGSANYFTNWDAPNFHRSYWGESPEYATTEGFTTQYRPAIFDPEYNSLKSKFFGNSTEDWKPGTTDQLNTLHYVSFNDLKNRGQYKYTGERTFNTSAGLLGYGPYAYASSYLVGAQLLFDGIDNAEAATNASNQLTGVKDKYYAYGYFWATEADYIRFAYRRMAYAFADGRNHQMNVNGTEVSMSGLDNCFYVQVPAADGGQPTYAEIAVKDATDYFETVPAQNVHGDGKLALSLKKDKHIYVRQESYNEQTKETTVSYVELTGNALTGVIYNYSQPARHYAMGAMYYAIPVQHLQGMSKGTRVELDRDATTAYKLGQFGVVRNHWYKLNIKTIGSIGTPVDDPDQPIIPDPEDEYYVALEIVVLPWHQVDNGSVGL